MELQIVLLVVCITSNTSAVLLKNGVKDTKPVPYNEKFQSFDQMQLTHTISSKADVTQLDTYCINNLKNVLTRHLSQYPRPQARQDANVFDDVFVEIAGRGGDLILPFPRTTLTIPQLLIALALLKGAVSPGIRGSDISNILVRKGTQAAQFFQAISHAAQGIAIHSSQQLNQGNTPTAGVTFMPVSGPTAVNSQKFFMEISTIPPVVNSEAAIYETTRRHAILPTFMPLRVASPPKLNIVPTKPPVNPSKVMQLVVNVNKMDLSIDKLSPEASVWNNNKQVGRLPLIVRLTGFDSHSTNSESSVRQLVKNISAIISRVKDQQITVSMSGDKNNPEIVLMFYAKNQNLVTTRPTNLAQQLLKRPSNFEYMKEQSLENNSQGKPVYWMNMFYPNGKPNIKNQINTIEPLTTYNINGLVKTSSTTKPVTTADPEYYEEDDDYVTSRYQEAIRARQ